jgi:hypothetical protein
MKHVEIDIHFVWEKVAIGQLHVIHVATNLQFADIMTKGLPREVFKDFRPSLCVLAGAAQTTGGGGRNLAATVPVT